MLYVQRQVIPYYISKSDTTPDAGVSSYRSIFYSNTKFLQATMIITFPRRIYVSAATTDYFLVNFNGGTENIGVIISRYPTYLRYTRRA